MPNQRGKRSQNTRNSRTKKRPSSKKDLDKTQRYSSTRSSSTKKKNENADGKTRIMKTIDAIKGKNKKEKNKKHKKHPKLMLALKIMIIGFLLLCIIGAGIIAAIFFGVFGNDFEITKDDLVISASNSKIVDVNGNVSVRTAIELEATSLEKQ